MVYYHTSPNIISLRNILLEYGAVQDLSPEEFMKTYIEKCPEEVDDNKLSWFIETFLGIQKHYQMLQEIASSIYEDENDENRNYLAIVLYSIIFQITPTNAKKLYKCLINLSKTLLNDLVKLTCNKQKLTFISQVAQKYFDMKYVTEKVMKPLITWEPQINEMNKDYKEFVQKIEQRKIKPLTVPIQLMLLNRKSKKVVAMPAPTPETPSAAVEVKPKKMLTKYTIDKKLEEQREKNKQKADNLLNEALNQTHHFAKPRTSTNTDKTSFSKDVSPDTYAPKQRTFKTNYNEVQIKENVAAVKRIEKTIQRSEEETVEWLDMLIKSCQNTATMEEMQRMERQERERERIYEIEKKHLLGQLSFEEAVIAKKKLADENKKKYEEFLKEKAKWTQEIEALKQEQLEQNRKQVEKLTLMELSLLEAKIQLATKKKQDGDKVRKEKEELTERFIKEKQQELDRKMNMIKEIKILAMIAKEARIPKAIDLTETSGCRLLCEMSFAELEERLRGIKLALHEELETKRNSILQERENAKQALIEAKNDIKEFLRERAELRREKKIEQSVFKTAPPSKEICDLKKLLMEKRNLRIKMTS